MDRAVSAALSDAYTAAQAARARGQRALAPQRLAELRGRYDRDCPMIMS